MKREDQIKNAAEIIAYGCSDELEAALIQDFPELKESEDKSFIEIPFGAKDSELCGWGYTIPEGMEAEIKDGKVIVKKKESEDERIRKELIEFLEFLEHEKQTTDNDFDKHVLGEWIAYLERQQDIWKERAQNITANMLEDKIEGIQRELIEFLSNTVNASWIDIIQSADAYAERIRNIIEKQKEQVIDKADKIAAAYQIGRSDERKQKEQKLVEDVIKNITKNKEAAIKFLKSAGIMDDNGELAEMYRSEQKPAEWSEEDEEIIYSLRSFLIQTEQSERYGSIQIAQIKKCLNWLKSLPERFNLQPKQEWSEEDEEILDSLIRLYSKEYSADAWPWANGAITYGDVVKFLKSLCPQPHWKPSEEQMSALKSTMYDYKDVAWYNNLSSLYDDLEKLT